MVVSLLSLFFGRWAVCAQSTSMLGPGQRVDTLRPYVIDPIEVTPDGGEDPAMRIMRMAIASAPYFRTQVAEYTADVYIKGSFNVGKLSRVVRRLSGGNFRDIREGTTYVDEALSEVVFTAPNHYVQKVKRRSSSLPDELAGGDPMRLINISIYDPVSIAISPLSPGAFGHYRFVYEGYSVDGDKVINRIRVTPVHRSSELLTGWLHIVEGDWSVRAFDLSGEA